MFIMGGGRLVDWDEVRRCGVCGPQSLESCVAERWRGCVGGLKDRDPALASTRPRGFVGRVGLEQGTRLICSH